MSTFNFSANISILFTEFPLKDRFKAAAEAGFKAIEMWWPYAELTKQEFKDLLTQNNLQCVGLNGYAGDAAKGEFGLAVDPANAGRFEASCLEAFEYAQYVDCPNVHVMMGKIPNLAPEGATPQATADLAYKHMVLASQIASRFGRTVLLEPLNPFDRPGYFLSRQDHAIEIIERLRAEGISNVKIMVDLYHIQRGEGNLIERMKKSLPYAGHLQLADSPTRTEPGTGETNFSTVFKALSEAGYKGWIGCEYKPSAGISANAQGWMTRLA